MKKKLLTLAVLCATFSAGAAPVDLKWIDKTPTYTVGQNFGVPFAKGEMNDYGTFTLTSSDGTLIPVQGWPMAHWNDGSVKWMGF